MIKTYEISKPHLPVPYFLKAAQVRALRQFQHVFFKIWEVHSLRDSMAMHTFFVFLRAHLPIAYFLKVAHMSMRTKFKLFLLKICEFWSSRVSVAMNKSECFHRRTGKLHIFRMWIKSQCARNLTSFVLKSVSFEVRGFLWRLKTRPFFSQPHWPLHIFRRWLIFQRVRNSNLLFQYFWDLKFEGFYGHEQIQVISPPRLPVAYFSRSAYMSTPTKFKFVCFVIGDSWSSEDSIAMQKTNIILTPHWLVA